MLTMTLLLLVSACAPVGVTDQVCAGWRPIGGTPADSDVVSDVLALSIDAHNRYGEAVGCW